MQINDKETNSEKGRYKKSSFKIQIIKWSRYKQARTIYFDYLNYFRARIANGCVFGEWYFGPVQRLRLTLISKVISFTWVQCFTHLTLDLCCHTELHHWRAGREMDQLTVESFQNDVAPNVEFHLARLPPRLKLSLALAQSNYHLPLVVINGCVSFSSPSPQSSVFIMHKVTRPLPQHGGKDRGPSLKGHLPSSLQFMREDIRCWADWLDKVLLNNGLYEGYEVKAAPFRETVNYRKVQQSTTQRHNVLLLKYVSNMLIEFIL